MFGMSLQPPDSTSDASGPSGLAPGSKGMQALLIAAISASSLSLLFSIGTAALSAAPAQDAHESAPSTSVGGEAGTDSSRGKSSRTTRVGRGDARPGSRASGVFG